MEHTKNLYCSLKHYFNALEQMGHYDIRETKNLIIYLFIVNEIYYGDLSNYLDDEGLMQFENVLKCVYDGCLINPVRDTTPYKRPRFNQSSILSRVTENDILRLTEDDEVRTPEQNI